VTVVVKPCSSSCKGALKTAGTRFFRRLGFDGFEAARKLVRDARAWGSPVYLDDRERHSSGRLEAHLRKDVDNLVRTIESLPSAEIADIARALANARRVRILGLRNSHIMASYLRWQLIMLRDRVVLAPVPARPPPNTSPTSAPTTSRWWSRYAAGRRRWSAGWRRWRPPARGCCWSPTAPARPCATAPPGLSPATCAAPRCSTATCRC